MTPDIDVIVPTRDRAARLGACLEALAQQTFKAVRVIVVDDASRIPVIDALTPRLRDQSLLVLRNDHAAGPSASRNRGVAAGDAPYLVFLDDDTRPHPDLLARHHAALERHPEPVVSVGPVLAPVAARPAPWNHWEADRLAREYRRIQSGETSPSWTHVYTGNVAMCRADLAAVGGFDERFTRQEDMELGFRLSRRGCRFLFDPDAVVWHETERTLADWLRIPAACARHDLLMDRLLPESGRLDSIREALRRRHWMLRVARRVLRQPKSRRSAVRLAIAAGGALHSIGVDRIALLAFSLVWDLEYSHALEEGQLDRQRTADVRLSVSGGQHADGGQ